MKVQLIFLKAWFKLCFNHVLNIVSEHVCLFTQ